MKGNWRISGDDIKTRVDAAWLVQRAPDAACLGLIIAIAWVLAQLTWLAVPSPDQPGAAALPQPPVAVAATPGQVDTLQLADRVASMHLFGRAAAPVAGGEPVNAPETNLNVTLHGIIAASDPDESRAIISAGSGANDSKSYRIGASIPGGASIHGIYADRVILSRNGRLEALKLPQTDENHGSIRRVPQQAPQATQPQPVQERRVPPRLRHSVAAMGHLLRAQRAVVNGKLVGYRVYPASNPAEFIAAGLQPGDVIKAVNGKSLSNPANLMALMGHYKAGEPIHLTVERNGQTKQIQVSAPQR